MARKQPSYQCLEFGATFDKFTQSKGEENTNTPQLRPIKQKARKNTTRIIQTRWFRNSQAGMKANCIEKRSSIQDLADNQVAVCNPMCSNLTQATEVNSKLLSSTSTDKPNATLVTLAASKNTSQNQCNLKASDMYFAGSNSLHTSSIEGSRVDQNSAESICEVNNGTNRDLFNLCDQKSTVLSSDNIKLTPTSYYFKTTPNLNTINVNLTDTARVTNEMVPNVNFSNYGDKFNSVPSHLPTSHQIQHCEQLKNQEQQCIQQNEENFCTLLQDEKSDHKKKKKIQQASDKLPDSIPVKPDTSSQINPDNYSNICKKCLEFCNLKEKIEENTKDIKILQKIVLSGMKKIDKLYEDYEKVNKITQKVKKVKTMVTSNYEEQADFNKAFQERIAGQEEKLNQVMNMLYGTMKIVHNMKLSPPAVQNTIPSGEIPRRNISIDQTPPVTFETLNNAENHKSENGAKEIILEPLEEELQLKNLELSRGINNKPKMNFITTDQSPASNILIDFDKFQIIGDSLACFIAHMLNQGESLRNSPYLRDQIPAQKLYSRIKEANFKKRKAILCMGQYELNYSNQSLNTIQLELEKIIQALKEKNFEQIFVLFPLVKPNGMVNTYRYNKFIGMFWKLRKFKEVHIWLSPAQVTLEKHPENGNWFQLGPDHNILSNMDMFYWSEKQKQYYLSSNMKNIVFKQLHQEYEQYFVHRQLKNVKKNKCIVRKQKEAEIPPILCDTGAKSTSTAKSIAKTQQLNNGAQLITISKKSAKPQRPGIGIKPTHSIKNADNFQQQYYQTSTPVTGSLVTHGFEGQVAQDSLLRMTPSSLFRSPSGTCDPVTL